MNDAISILSVSSDTILDVNATLIEICISPIVTFEIREAKKKGNR